MAEIVEDVRASSEPIRRFIGATHGAGMSTELRRLERMLHADRDPPLAVRIDLEEALRAVGGAEPASILVALQAGIERQVAAADGLLPIYGGALWQMLHGYERWDPDAARAERVFAAWRDDPSARRNLLARFEELRSPIWDAHEEDLTLLNDRAVAAGYRGIVVLVDSLNHMPSWSGSRHVWNEHHRLPTVFGRRATPVHMIWSQPLSHHGAEPEARLLPEVRVRTRAGSEEPAALRAAREVIDRRDPGGLLRGLLDLHPGAASIDEVFGSWNGRPRDLLRMMQTLVAYTSTGGRRGDPVTSVFEREYRELSRAVATVAQPMRELLRSALPQPFTAKSAVIFEGAISAGLAGVYRERDVWIARTPLLDDVLAGMEFTKPG